VVETAHRPKDRHRVRARGMAERRMAEIVGQRQRLGQIFIDAECGANARDTCVTSSVWVSRVR